METIRIRTPLDELDARKLTAGDKILLSGTIYTARDSAHKRMIEMLEEGTKLPFQLEGAVIYYAGPTPPKPGRIVGSIGPTTSYRMDPYTPTLIHKGLRGTIGKGPRNEEVAGAMAEHGAVYFAATGGVAALISKAVRSMEIIAFEDLGPEAIRKLEVEDMPLIVAQDSKGGNLYVCNKIHNLK